jgi:hypothetical protein
LLQGVHWYTEKHTNSQLADFNFASLKALGILMRWKSTGVDLVGKLSWCVFVGTSWCHALVKRMEAIGLHGTRHIQNDGIEE